MVERATPAISAAPQSQLRAKRAKRSANTNEKEAHEAIRERLLPMLSEGRRLDLGPRQKGEEAASTTGQEVDPGGRVKVEGVAEGDPGEVPTERDGDMPVRTEMSAEARASDSQPAASDKDPACPLRCHREVCSRSRGAA